MKSSDLALSARKSFEPETHFIETSSYLPIRFVCALYRNQRARLALVLISTAALTEVVCGVCPMRIFKIENYIVCQP